METKTIYQKLFALRKEIKPLKKEQEGYNYKYFDINQMINQIQPLLEKNNLLLIQPLTELNGNMALVTKLVDIETGEGVEHVTPLIELQDPQKMGGCITYFRRYALQSFLFMEAEDDDAASTKDAKQHGKRKVEKKTPVDTNTFDPPF